MERTLMERAQKTPVDHRVETDGAVATITLARPQAYNALTADLLESLLTTFRSLERDASVRAIVLTGEGKAFCSGQALDDARTLPPDGKHDLGATVERRYGPLLLKILTIEKPVIAAVNGVAAGAGMGIACACDFRIVAESASFTTAFVKIGLVPDSGLSLTLPKLIGYPKALELCMLSEKIDAARADALGLCTKVVPLDSCVSEARSLAAALAKGPRAIGLIKRELLRNGLGDVHNALAYEAHLQSVAGATEDFAEGLAAFAAKRAPEFRGA
jgi:2-(1,2-epoxy-1,2-dihydrophenyl)acetyl-CoA isomerase